MKKTLLLLAISVFILSCNQMSEEEKLIHNQKIISGIQKKKADLDKILVKINKQNKRLLIEFDDVNSFKIGRSSSTKRRQIAALKEKSKALNNYRENTKKLKDKLDMLHKTFDWQESPKSVVEKVFEIARYENYEKAIFLADPYDENDSDVDGISYVAAHPKEYKQQFSTTFREGRIIGEPIIYNKTAKIEFLFGRGANRKETMNLIKRGGSWYLSSF